MKEVCEQISLICKWRIWKEFSRMKARHGGLRCVYWILGVSALLLPALVVFASLRTEEAFTQNATTGSQKKTLATAALRLNSLGVAYLNQGKAAEGQKYFEQALATDPGFAVARMNLGIALLAQQKMEQARAALGEGTSKLPDAPPDWTNP